MKSQPVIGVTGGTVRLLLMRLYVQSIQLLTSCHHFKGWAPYVGIVFANGLFLNTFPAVWNAVSADVLPDSFNIVVSELALWDT